MKKVLNICFTLIIVVFIVSCNSDQSEKIPADADKKNEILLDSNQAYIYTVPTPVQVTSALKLLDINYSEPLIKETKESKTPFLSSFSKAVNLGIYLVDFAYVVIYDDNQASAIYFSKIERLTKELDLQNQKTTLVLDKCKTYMNNKDSLYKTLLSFQNEIDRKLFESQKEEISLLIVSGFYIEGLYILTEYYEKLTQKKALTQFYSNNMNNIILQQKIYLESLIELLKMYPNDEFKKLAASFENLKISFDKLNIKYEYSDKEKRLKNVSFDPVKIKDIKTAVINLRKSIITDTYK